MIYPGDVDQTGPLEVVFDWSTDACIPDNVPDAPVRPFRDAAGNINLNISHYTNYRMVGPTFDSLVLDCTPTMVSDYDSLPQNYNDHEWLMSMYTHDGVNIAAYVHNEHHGYEYAGQCSDSSSNNYLSCWYNTITYASSSDSGRTFTQPAVPNHYAMGVPYKQDSTGPGPYGIFGGSNIIKSPVDGYYYRAIQVENYGAQQVGMSMTRTDDPFDPTSWRGWDGEDFTISFADPYRTPNIIDTNHVVEPVGVGYIEKMNACIKWSTYFNRFILVGAAQKSGVWGFYYALSNDLIHWTARHPIIQDEVLINPNAQHGLDFMAYASLVDHNDTTRNFEVVGQDCYLYYTIWHTSNGLFDRDLVRLPIRFNKLEVEGWEINAGGQQYDDNPGDGRCATPAGKCNIMAAIQESNNRLPMDSSFIATVEFNTTLTNINVNNQMFGIQYPMIIDGTTKTGFSDNTTDFGVAMDLAPAVTINLNGNGGFGFQAKNSGIKGVAIKNYSGAAVGFTADSGFVEGCILGSDAAGLDEYISTTNGYGINIADAAHIRIGGSTPDKRNMILGGITLDGEETYDISILGNYIGTDRNGDSVYYHNTGGVTLQNGAYDVQIGGNSLNERNIISGFTAPGITIGTGSYDVDIIRNLIGTDASGTQGRGNLRAGISLADTTWNVNILDNVIAGNSVDEAGIWAVARTHDVTIQGNYIGTDTTGTINLGNGTSTNQSNGIIIGNLAYNVEVGGTNPGEGNTIAFNNGAGIMIYGNAGTGNAILGNKIYDNTKMGIDLQGDNSPHGNDDGDADTGANDFQNYPVLSSATTNGDSLIISGTLNSVASSTYRVEFFINTACDTFTASYGGYGEGEEYLGFQSVTTDASGNAEISFTVYSPGALGRIVTTTATNANNGTSEFSQCETVVEPEADMTLSTHAFLETLTGASAADTLLISSTGTADLSWAATKVESWMSISPASGSLSSGDSTYMVITYDATSLTAGNTYQDTITLTSNDPDQLSQELPVEISVQAQPDIHLAVDTLTVTIPEGGTLTKSFAIDNLGSDPLTWQLATQAGISWLHQVQPNSGTIAGNSTGSASVKCQDASLTEGAYYGAAWISSNDPDESQVIFTVELIVTAGGSGGGGSSGGGGGTPKQPDIHVTTDTLFATVPQGGSQTMSIPVENKGDTTLTWSFHKQPNAQWIITFPPTNGSIAPNQTQNIQLKVEAGSFSPGTYTANTWINTNDSDEMKVDVIVRMTVQDTSGSGGGGGNPGPKEPNISVGVDTLFAVVQQGGTKTMSIPVENKGDTTLTWSYHTQAGLNWVITFPPTNGNLGAGESQNIQVKVEAGSFPPGTFNANTWIDSNDPDENKIYVPIRMTVQDTTSSGGGGMPAKEPDITIETDSLLITVLEGGTAIQDLGFTNDGDTTLNWSAQVQSGVNWLSVQAPSSGQLQPSDTSMISFQATASGLVPGSYMATATLTSDDPDKSSITIFVELTVTSNGGGSQTGNPDLQFSVSQTAFCPGDTVQVNYQVLDTVLESGNAFLFLMSSATGDFANPDTIGHIASDQLQGSFTAYVPKDAMQGSAYVFRLVSTHPALAASQDLSQISVKSLPGVNLSPFAPVCANEASIELKQGAPAGGQYYGTGVSNGYFDPVNLSPGTYTISYFYTNQEGCSNEMSGDIMVKATPQISFPSPSSDICETGDPIELTMGSPIGGLYQGPGVKNGFFEPGFAGPGQHTVWYAVEENGCTDSASAVISVQASPQVSIDPVDPVCVDEPAIDLTASPAGGVFIGSGITANQFDPSQLAPGFYTIFYEVTEGVCTAKGEKEVEVLPLPPAPMIQVNGDSLIVAGQYEKIEWYLDGQLITGAFGSSYKPEQSGNYSVKAFNSAGCVSGSDPLSFQVASTGITDMLQHNWSVYPNPATSQVTLSWDPGSISARSLDIRVFDNLGRMVSAHRAMTSDSELQLRLHTWSRGVYTIVFRAGMERSVRKLVVE